MTVGPLAPREERLLHLRSQGAPISRIAAMWGLTPARVRQLAAHAHATLIAYHRSAFPDTPQSFYKNERFGPR